MKVIYTYEPIELEGDSIFLIGPTPRMEDIEAGKDVKSWRPDAIDILNDLKFAGTVLIPERRDGTVQFNYLNQVEWEWEGLNKVTLNVAWVPRNMETMLALTTNVEFGYYMRNGNLIYGRPDGAPHTAYLDWLYQKSENRLPKNTLESLLEFALKRIDGIMFRNFDFTL